MNSDRETKLIIALHKDALQKEAQDPSDYIEGPIRSVGAGFHDLFKGLTLPALGATFAALSPGGAGKIGAAGVRAGAELTPKVAIAALAAPLLLGSGLGVASQKLDEPSDTDVKRLQNLMIEREYKEALKSLTRRQQIALKKEKAKQEAGKERSIKI